YIGKAGGANSSATLHYGGRYVWQLEKPRELVVCWKPTPNEDPRTLEKQLISEFVTQFAKRPFANLTD
ncbi:MAG: hypothetical protein C0490_12000, partial [Marivirga sp.]|nr:hypothetical protein [Marivirga sp.]